MRMIFKLVTLALLQTIASISLAANQQKINPLLTTNLAQTQGAPLTLHSRIHSSDTMVAKFDPDSGWPLQATPVAGIDDPSLVYSLGRYALATSNSFSPTVQVAYFNGESWSPATQLNTQLTYYYAAYPETASEPNGWFIPSIWISAHSVQPYYFDGSNWHQQTIAWPNNDQIKPAVINTQGHAWIITTDAYSTFYNFSSNSWSTPQKLPLTTANKVAGNNGTAYVLGSNENGNEVLIKSEDGNAWQQIANYPNNIKYAGAVLYVHGNNIIVSNQVSSSSANITYSTDGGKSWATTNNLDDMLTNSSLETMAGGIVWMMPLPSLLNGQLAYFDTQHPEQEIQIANLITNTGILPIISVSADGTLACALGYTSDVTMGCYNIATHQNLPVGTLAKYANSISYISALNDDKVVAVGTDKNNHAAAFYFHDNTWHTTNIAGMNMITRISYAVDQPVSGMFEIGKTPVWAIGSN